MLGLGLSLSLSLRRQHLRLVLGRLHLRHLGIAHELKAHRVFHLRCELHPVQRRKVHPWVWIRSRGSCMGQVRRGLGMPLVL